MVQEEDMASYNQRSSSLMNSMKTFDNKNSQDPMHQLQELQNQNMMKMSEQINKLQTELNEFKMSSVDMMK